MFCCERWVRLSGVRGRSVERVYASERGASGARSRGARVEQCSGSEVSVSARYEAHYGYGGYSGSDEFVGVEVCCSRCGSRVVDYGIDELEELVRADVVA